MTLYSSSQNKPNSVTMLDFMANSACKTLDFVTSHLIGGALRLKLDSEHSSDFVSVTERGSYGYILQ